MFLIIGLMVLSTISSYLLKVEGQGNQVVFRVGWGGTSFDTFNPFTTIAQISLWSTSDVYDYLVRFDKTYTNFIPDLAVSWEEVNTTYIVFHLVKNATFTDGVKVTAEDVKYSFNLALQDWSRLAPNLKGLESCDVIDNYTVGFKVKSIPMFMIMGATAVPIVPKHIWEKVENPATYADNPPIGSGPLMVTEYKEGQYIVLERNPNFFRKSWLPHVDKIVISFYSDTSSAANALKAGDVDAVGPYIPRAMIEGFQSDPRFKVVVPPAVFYYYLSFNVYPEGLGNPTLRDVRVRQALAHAVNVTYLAEMSWDGFAKPIATPVATSNPFHNPYLKPYTFNLTLANELLDKAGYKMGSDGVRRAPDGTPLRYTMLVPSNLPELVRVAQQIATWWKQVGVDAKVEAMDTGSMTAKIWVKVDNTTTLGHDIDLWDWFMTPSDPTFLSIFLSNQVPTETSDSGYVNETYDKLYEDLFNAPDMETARKIAWEMQEMVYRDLPYINLFEVSTPQAYNVRFTGFSTDWPGGPFGGYDWTVFLEARLAEATTTTSAITTAVSYTTSPTSTQTTTPPAVTSVTSTALSTTATPSGMGASTITMVVAIVVLVVIIAGISWYLLRRR
ncbi:MAG: peptide ABC transporter substrate-binding protein [Zestosphaera tikiterensis]|uniref:Peptide ABC transporter substrate-binding protein n=1 Tax=Zestosphaera tikiterensis TaxID=1973259 RepID=A0A2R7Y3Y1_9CREN|nr:MAG: peptide ABC transporter substrate-binding protein [Zestosphaera tikiterensis]